MTDVNLTSTLDRPPAFLGPAGPGGPQGGFTGGVALLLLAALAALGLLVAVQGLVTPGDAARTANDVAASATRFRLGVASMYVVVVLDVVAAWALFRFFAPVDASLSRLAAWFRLAYSAVFLVAISQLAGVPDLLSNPDYQRAFGQEQLHAQALTRIESFDAVWMAGLLLFGAHLALVGYLAYRSGYVPRLIGVLVALAGVGYAIDTIASVLFTDPYAVSTLTGFGEAVLAVWLVARGRRLARRDVA
jgi:hypothetical protein